MQFLRCVAADVVLLPPRLLRTRLGVWLAGLGMIVVWLSQGGDPLAAALHAGALASVVGAAMDQTERDRLALSLSHPTTPLALATARWLGAVLPAGALALVSALALDGGFGAVLAGVAAAAAVGGCAVAAVLAFGNGAALALFLCMAVAGAVPPEELVALADPGFIRVAAASALELGPALWRYRDVAVGDAGAALHAMLWGALGIALTCGLLRRPVRPTACPRQ